MPESSRTNHRPPTRTAPLTDEVMVSSHATRWCIPAQADLHWKVWGDEAVVFHPPSGDTHVLHLIAAETLFVLTERGCATADELSHHLAAALEVENDETVLRHVEQCLAQFHELGLIEPVHAAA